MERDVVDTVRKSEFVERDEVTVVGEVVVNGVCFVEVRVGSGDSVFYAVDGEGFVWVVGLSDPRGCGEASGEGVVARLDGGQEVLCDDAGVHFEWDGE